MLEATSTVIQALAILVTAYFASRGLNAWRVQLVGKRRMEVAEEALVATYKVRDILIHVRNPGAFGGEGESRQPGLDEPDNVARLRNTYFVPLERLRAHTEEFAQFQKARVLCQAYFGPAADGPFQEIMSARWAVIVGAQMLISTAGEERTDPKLRQKWEARIWAGVEQPDELASKIDAAVAQIEALCRPHLA